MTLFTLSPPAASPSSRCVYICAGKKEGKGRERKKEEEERERDKGAQKGRKIRREGQEG
ncbi:hypothetical protein E2C01_045524 [Portunus trituberculatus]|uniref:Uncharacterized protein n=1 Tax=Portunus trituberculatus TaxID=210409 RepID=A0A5B7FYK6_PORTR|nr:hypothetical protein [Portunus trituberculatus]